MQRILDQLNGVKKTRNGYIAKCPSHDDRSPSLSVAQADDGRILLYCFAGCCNKDICEALGMSLSDLFPDGKKMSPKQKKQQTEAQRQRKLQAKYQELIRRAFIAMCEFRDLTVEVFENEGLDIPSELVIAVHKLPQIEHYLEILTTGSEEDKLELLRGGIITKWAKLYRLPKQTLFY